MTTDTSATPRDNADVDALTSPAVAGITRLSAVDTVRGRIALSIELGLLQPEEALPSDFEVAAALEVSEITVRRALKRLADDGLIVRRRGRGGGTFVAPQPKPSAVDAVTTYRGDATKVHSLIDRRVLIEAAVTHHAALSATEEQLAELEGYVDEAARAKNWSDYHAADEKLHTAVARASGLEWALPHYHEVLYALYKYFLPYPVDYLHRVNLEHAELVAALRHRDPVAAVEVIERHVSALHGSMFMELGAES